MKFFSPQCDINTPTDFIKLIRHDQLFYNFTCQGQGQENPNTVFRSTTTAQSLLPVSSIKSKLQDGDKILYFCITVVIIMLL